MTTTPPPFVDPQLPSLLALLHEQFSAGDDVGQLATLDEIGVERRGLARTLVGALFLGGLDFASRLVACTDGALDQDGRYLALLDAFDKVVTAPPGAPQDHEVQVVEVLVEQFGLAVEAPALLDTVRAEFLITIGPLEDVPEAALTAMRHARWDLALRGFARMQHKLQQETPRNVYGMAAMCLHKLGRYGEAEAWAQRGLGVREALLAIGPVHTEAELLHRWSGRRSPVVSIICPTYNHVRYIESAIRGFLSQDSPYPFEILIHDDASTDGTQRVIRAWQERYPTVIRPVLQSENQYSKGVRPFELLLAKARGQFVAVCEGDDFWVDPGKLRKQVGFLLEHEDFSCSAHNYYHYLETTLTVRPWFQMNRDFTLSQRQLMGLVTLLWLPTLVFRKSFSVMPPERDMAAIGDQFLTSYLGTKGRCMYFATMLGSVRRENEFSIWSPLPSLQKEQMRIKTWSALVRLHERLGNQDAVSDLKAKIAASPLDEAGKAALLDTASTTKHLNLAEA
ncbi:MAG: glycosyltransferase family 2 protein [Burkholderiales bacterium]|nr:glycosyltransferase family 2 protein [Burkholderiales bacterium]